MIIFFPDLDGQDQLFSYLFLTNLLQRLQDIGNAIDVYLKSWPVHKILSKMIAAKITKNKHWDWCSL